MSAMLPRDQFGILHVVALSGGKDSTALALRLKETDPDTEYVYVCTPTGDEPPALFAHWRLLGDRLGRRILPIMVSTLDRLIREQRAIPNHAQRWCTRKLKLEPYYGWLADQAKVGPVISYVGLRADEESRPGMIFPDAPGITMNFPLATWGWGLEEVVSYNEQQGIIIPERTDCRKCFWQTLAEWYLLWRDDLECYLEAEALEAFVTEERGQAYTFRSPQRDSWPAGLRDMRILFEEGHVPERSLELLAWSRRKIINMPNAPKRRLVGACRACTL